MKIYADIILSGKDFDPDYFINKYNIYFRKHNKKNDFNKRLNKYENEGYGILSLNDNDTSEEIILKLLSVYEIIQNELNNKIEHREFNLFIESGQNSVTLNLEYLVKIKDYFSTINISFIEI